MNVANTIGAVWTAHPSHSIWPQRARAAARGTVIALTAVATLAAFLPLAPAYPDGSLDSNWAFALNVAVAKGLIFGRDIVFTFGPYAAAFTGQYHPATDARALWCAGGLGLAFAAALLALARGAGRASAALLAAALVLVPRDTLFLLLPVALVALACRTALPPDHPGYLPPTRARRGVLIGLAVAVGAMTLVKGTFAAAACVGIALAVIALIVSKQRVLAGACGLACPAAIAFGWAAAGQPLWALPGYFAALGPVVSGYTDAMSLPGSDEHLVLFVCGAAAAAVVVGLSLRRGGPAGALLGIGAAALLFIGFKAGFVRQDLHVLIAPGMLALVTWLLALGIPVRFGAIALAAALAVWGVVLQDETALSPWAAASAVAAADTGALAGLAERFGRPDQRRAAFAAALAAIRTKQPVPAVRGTIDVYSYGQGAILARDLNWDPRPVLQSYSAYTPALERLDAMHLSGASAPQQLLFTVQPIDGRLAALEDGTSWPELLARYTLTSISGETAALRVRSGDPARAPIGTVPLAAGTFALGEPIALPAQSPAVWARIDVHPTPLGSIVGALYKLPALTITYRFADGSEQPFRYIAALGAAGFVAAPLIKSTTDFLALELPPANDYFAGRPPQSLTISAAAGAGSLWSGTLHAVFFALRIAPQPIEATLFAARVPVAGRTFALETVFTGGERVPATGGPVTVNAGDTVGIAGWALDARQLKPLKTLLIGIDGEPNRAVPEYGAYRPDVVNVVHDDAAANSGFHTDVSLAGLAKGLHRVRFAALASDGTRTTLPAAVTIRVH